jgi:tetratricopeptide (TPR) repeat protein
MDMLRLRKELDDAITYGRTKAAFRLIKEGLLMARHKELLGELEYFKGQSCIMQGDYFHAISHFDKAVYYNHKDGASYNDRALCMVELGLLKEALTYFDKGIEVEPDYATIYHNKGWLLNKTGRHTEAIGYFKKTLQMEPGRAVTYENLGDALAHLGNYREAAMAYKKAILLLKSASPGIKKQLLRRLGEMKKNLQKRRRSG